MELPPTVVTYDFQPMMVGNTFPRYEIASLRDATTSAQIPILAGSLQVRDSSGALVTQWVDATFIIEGGNAILAEVDALVTAGWAAGNHVAELILVTDAGSFTYARGQFPVIQRVNDYVPEL